MAQKPVPGCLAGKMKWLVTRYPKPYQGLIFLGSILTDPSEPETSLNRKTGAIQIPEDDKIDDSVAVRQQIQSELSTNGSALLDVMLPNSPLISAGVKAQGSWSHQVKTTVEAMNVKAEIFLPDPGYMNKVLAKPEVTAYVKDGAWARSLYMIVGVATAGTLSMTEEQSRHLDAALSAHASIIGTDIQASGELSGGSKAEGSSKLQTDTAADFAYRVREFEYRKFWPSGKKLKDKGDRCEGAMFGSGARDDEASGGDDDTVPEFWKWVEDDVEGLGILALQT